MFWLRDAVNIKMELVWTAQSLLTRSSKSLKSCIWCNHVVGKASTFGGKRLAKASVYNTWQSTAPCSKVAVVDLLFVLRSSMDFTHVSFAHLREFGICIGTTQVAHHSHLPAPSSGSPKCSEFFVVSPGLFWKSKSSTFLLRKSWILMFPHLGWNWKNLGIMSTVKSERFTFFRLHLLIHMNFNRVYSFLLSLWLMCFGRDVHNASLRTFLKSREQQRCQQEPEVHMLIEWQVSQWFGLIWGAQYITIPVCGPKPLQQFMTNSWLNHENPNWHESSVHTIKPTSSKSEAPTLTNSWPAPQKRQGTGHIIHQPCINQAGKFIAWFPLVLVNPPCL